MNRPEQLFHQSVAQYLAAILPPEVVFTTVGHGGGGRVRGALLKSMGVLPGVPDIMICWLERACRDPIYGWRDDAPAIFWLELKSTKGRLSPAQQMFRERVLALGHCWALCRTLEQVEAALRSAGVPVRGHSFLKSGAVKLEMSDV